MTRLDTTVSAVFSYTERLANDYLRLSGDTDQVQSEVNAMHTRVQQAESNVRNQVYQAQQLRDEAASKRSYYESMVRQAAEEVSRAQAEVQYVLDHPIQVTEYDNDGNAYTHYEVDQAALSAAQSRLSQAQSEYYYYQDKYNQAAAVERDAIAAVTRFEAMQKAITLVEESIQEDVRRIDSYRSQIQAEANYNLNGMQKVKDKLTNYLNCRDFFKP